MIPRSFIFLLLLVTLPVSALADDDQRKFAVKTISLAAEAAALKDPISIFAFQNAKLAAELYLDLGMREPALDIYRDTLRKYFLQQLQAGKDVDRLRITLSKFGHNAGHDSIARMFLWPPSGYIGKKDLSNERVRNKTVSNLLRLAMLSAKLNGRDSSKPYLAAAEKILTKSKTPAFDLAETYYKIGFTKKAFEIFDSIKNLNPPVTEAPESKIDPSTFTTPIFNRLTTFTVRAKLGLMSESDRQEFMDLRKFILTVRHIPGIDGDFSWSLSLTGASAFLDASFIDVMGYDALLQEATKTKSLFLLKLCLDFDLREGHFIRSRKSAQNIIEVHESDPTATYLKENLKVAVAYAVLGKTGEARKLIAYYRENDSMLKYSDFTKDTLAARES